jgi:polyisoprenoid-binding protein YceI
MKSILSTFMALAILVIATSCGTGSSQTASASEVGSAASDAVEVVYKVSPASSEVTWLGEVAGVYGHNGVIDIAEGSVTATGNTISGGTVVIDMTTIQPLDTASYTASGKTPQDLVNHLTTGDFFLVEEYPTATFVIKSHVGDKLIGDLTIRGNTKQEEATITSLVVTEEGLTAKADLVFDRQDYDVAWVHYMKDMILSDDIKLGITIVAQP